MTDKGEPGSNDTIGITLWDGSTLLFSSEWNGAKTLEMVPRRGQSGRALDEAPDGGDRDPALRP